MLLTYHDSDIPDGLGYYDDGEERLGDEAGTQEKHAKKRNSTAAMTSASLKKARKAKAAMQAMNASSSGNHNENEDEDGAVHNNRSMWDFVQRGSSGAANSATNRPSARPVASRGTSRPAKSVDDLLDQLDSVAAAPARGRGGRSSMGGNRRRSAPPARRRPTAAGSSSVRAGAKRASYGTTSAHQRDQQQYEEPDDDTSFPVFGGDDDDDYPQESGGDAMNTSMDDPSPSSAAPTPSKKDDMDMDDVSTPASKVRFADNNESGDAATPSSESMEAVTPGSTDRKDGDNQEGGDKPAPRRLVRPKLGKRSAPAQKAKEEQEQQATSAASAAAAAAANKAKAMAMDTSSISFQPEDIAAESASAANSAAAAANLEAYVETETSDDGEKRFVDMFWIDAVEKKGDIYLFGKVASPNDKTKFVSCCAIVTGNLRNLFVLPRKDAETGEPVDMMEVHKEVKGILQPGCIPAVAGASWAGKVVERQYAFDDPEVPREATQYLKVVYDAKFPTPSQEICQQGGQYIQKILNAGASNMETFVLKRKLNGPCWIRIQDPQPNTRGQVSWCAMELKVETPKNVKRLDLAVKAGTPPRPAPPVVSVTLKMKTVVNPKTHKNEIVSVSAVCHKQVQLDTSSDESRRFMTQLSLIRPVHDLDSDNTQGMAKFPRDIDTEIKAKMPQLQKMPNERALLSRLVTQIGIWDPDVLVGHNAWGHDMQVILARCVEHKVKTWSKMGRYRKMELPNKSYFSSGKDWAIGDALSGRLLCDTYLAAKEHLRETTYSLKNLAETQLKTSRQEIEPMDVPQYFQSSRTIVGLALHTLNDAQLVQRLMFKLQILPLSKQLTCIAGNMWSQTLKSNRAGRTEYLLLHEFHRLKYLAPEKSRGKKDEGSGKAKYLGGLVLEPKKGLYDSFILLLDFNSLYPSLIQEYNLCFTTVDQWARYHQGQVPAQGEDGAENLPPLPENTSEKGVLPRVIKSLVDRRRVVKKMMKSESSEDKRSELDIRQMALKLTANSMYGCLGFSNSRFFAQPIAAMVTSMGRQTLQKTVEIAQSTLGLDVIYGDTDSIMINTRISDTSALRTVRELGEQVKKEVNKLYKTLELEIDGVFKSMLLLKKKKYAAVTVEEGKNGELILNREEKGLDLVRRDWCIQSKDSGRFILDRILSDEDKDNVVSSIFSHLEDLANKMRSGELPLEKYVITKGLSKHPNDYPDGKSQPHVHVAKMMIKNNQRLTVGDHIPYIITESLDSNEQKSGKVSKGAAERARHPDEILRSNGVLKPDIEWYLSQQILPPVSRLCEPIEGISQGLLAQKLGLDAAKYSHVTGSMEIDDDQLVDFKPTSSMSDQERFKDVKKLCITCNSCGVESEFPGIFYPVEEAGKQTGVLAGGLQCTNPGCSRPKNWGEANHYDCMSKIQNAITVLVNSEIREYYKGTIKCDDPLCGLETRQLSVVGGVCLRRGCNGQMRSLVDERSLHTQLKYLECLFDRKHACKQFERRGIFGSEIELEKSIPRYDQAVYDEICNMARKAVDSSAFNWISPNFWTSMFGQIGMKMKQ